MSSSDVFTGGLPLSHTIGMENHYIESMLRVLHQQRALNFRIQNLKSRISRLPPELLSQIFVTAVAQEASKKRFTVMQTVVPLHLSHVCYAWRCLAFDLSEIWATVHCRVKRGKTSAQARLLSEWLSRSKAQPLSIRISFEDEASWIDSHSKVIIMTLIPYSHRWRHLDLVILKSWFPILELIHGMVENIESLSLRTPGPILYMGLHSFFAEAPRLRKVSLKSADFTFPWTKITSINLHSLSAYRVTPVLQHFPHLISGKFLDLNDGLASLIFSPPHLALEHLSISFKESSIAVLVETILNQLTLPKLCHLTLILPIHEPSPLHLVGALVERSGCPLKSVEIGGPILSEEEIVHFLQFYTHVVHVNNHVHPFILLDYNDD